MLLRIICCFFCLFVFASKAPAQSVSTGAAAAPTTMGSDLSLDDDPDALTRIPGTSVRDSGGPASYTGLSLRGARAKEVSVSLEGIPLNSASSGDFDLGLLSPFGLSRGRLLRGGYSPLSSSPDGNLLFRLPLTEARRVSLGGGDFDSLFAGIQIPNATFSFDQSENNFPYERNGKSFTRQNNSHRRYNMRTWLRRENWQIWAQVLYVDLELPGSVDFSSMPSRSQTLRPTTAFQFRSGAWSTDLRFDFQDQDLKDEPSNRWYSGGAKLTYRNEFSPRLSYTANIEEGFDKLTSGNFSSRFRSTTALSGGLLWSPRDGHLIHPFVRTEAVTDLDQIFSVHPGLGGRHEILKSLSLLWNFSFIQRAPTFNEVYFKIPKFYEPNRKLDRETSLQGDIGYEWIGPDGLQIRQSFYINAKEDLIETVDIGGGLYQAQNVGQSLTWGIENSAELPLRENFQISGDYTFQWSRVGSRHEREALYQPRHRLSVEPELFPNHFVSLGLPLYARSSVLASTSGARVKAQWDLGFHLKTQAIPKIFPFEFRLRAKNLLGWSREETLGYPLSHRPSVQASLTYNF